MREKDLSIGTRVLSYNDQYVGQERRYAKVQYPAQRSCLKTKMLSIIFSIVQNTRISLVLLVCRCIFYIESCSYEGRESICMKWSRRAYEPLFVVSYKYVSSNHPWKNCSNWILRTTTYERGYQ